MADKFLSVDTNGTVKETAPITTSSGVSDANKIVSTGADGRFDISVMPLGIGADTKVAIASEALSAGNYVNLYDNAGTINVRKADASGGIAKKADGFVIAAVAQGANATVYFDGTITGLSGLTIGATYFLSATAGAGTATAPTTSGHILQSIGKALSATELTFEAGDPIIRA